MEGADGVKTGYTKAAGRILVSSASRSGRRIIAVTLDDPDDWRDHAALLEEGFSRFTVQTVVKSGQYVGTAEVVGGQTHQVQLLAAEDFSYALAPEERPQIMVSGENFVYAPAVTGADAGYAYILIEGNAVGKVPLVYGQTIEQSIEEEETLWEWLRGIISGI